jgi:recombination DNA repair RAD52 pathway protein
MIVNPRHELRPLSDQQLDFLLGDLQESRVRQRDTPGSKQKMSYLAAWDVRRVLLIVFGFGGWSGAVDDTKIVRIEDNLPKFKWVGKYPNAKKELIEGEYNYRVTVQVTYSLYVHQLGTIFTEVAIASQTGADPGDVADFAAKTAASDAMKRCAMNLGTQFGLSLYDDGSLADVVKTSFSAGQRKIDRIEMEMERRRIEKEQIANIERNRAAIASGEETPVAAAERQRQENLARVAPAEPDGWYQEPQEEAGSTATEPPVQQAAPKAEPKPPARTKRAIDDEMRAQEEASAAEEATPEPEQGPAAALDPEIPSQAVSEAARDAAREKLRRGFTG